MSDPNSWWWHFFALILWLGCAFACALYENWIMAGFFAIGSLLQIFAFKKNRQQDVIQTRSENIIVYFKKRLGVKFQQLNINNGLGMSRFIIDTEYGRFKVHIADLLHKSLRRKNK